MTRPSPPAGGSDSRPAPIGRLSVLVLAAGFVYLWTPLGQFPALLFDWQYFGPFIGACVLAATLAPRGDGAGGIGARPGVMGLLFFAYTVHQFEEHGYDLLGQTFAFETYMDAVLGPIMGCAEGAKCPFDRMNIFMINTIMVWWPLGMLIALGRGSLTADLCGVAILFVNAILHIVASLVFGNYNPGLLTAIVVFFPVSAYAVHRLFAIYGPSRTALFHGFIYGVFLHAGLMAATLFTYVFTVIPLWLYPIILFAIATVPLVIRLRVPRPAVLAVSGAGSPAPASSGR